MANADAELQILISTAAELYGMDNAQTALAKYKNSVKESGEGAERHNEHHREMRRLFGELNKVLPESGHLLHGLFGGPQVLLIMAAVVAVSKFVEIMKEQKKTTEELLKLQADVAMAVWVKQREEARAATDEVERFNKAMEATARAYDSLKEKQETAMKVLEVYNQALEKSAKGDVEKDANAERLAAGRKQILMDQIVAEDVKAVHDAEAKLATAQEARAGGVPGSAGAAKAEAEAAHAKAEFEKAQAAVQKIEEERGKRVAPEVQTAMTFGGIQHYQASEKDFNERAKKANDDLAAAHSAYISNNAAIEAHKRKMEDLNGAVAEYEKEVTQRVAALRSARSAAAQNRAVTGAHLETEDSAKMQEFGLRTGSVAGRTALHGVEAFEKLGHGRLGADQEKTMDAIVQALREAGNSNQVIYKLFVEMRDMHVDQATKVRDLLNAMHLLKAQNKSTVNP